MSKDTLYLIDGTSLCYRSFFALKLSTSKGVPTGAVYGFYQTLKKIISRYNPSHMGVCFDVSRKTFRQDKFKEYKANRRPLPDELKMQLPMVKELVGNLGIKVLEKEGYEADDVIASLCEKAVKDNLPVVIVSSDKDFYQLVDKDKVSVYNYHKDKFFDKDEFLKEYMFDPAFVIDYLALAGDSSDNIPGAKGIGKIGAAKLVREFGTIERIFNNLDKISPKMRDLLIKGKEDVLLSRELATLHSCSMEVGVGDLALGEPDFKEIYKMFSELEFKALLKDIPKPCVNLDLKVKEGVPEKLLQNLVKEPLITFTEKTGAFVFDPVKKCIYKTPVGQIKQILNNEGIKKISYDFKGQMDCLQEAEIKGAWFDVKIAAYLLDSSLADYSLSALDSYYLGDFVSEISAEFSPYFIYQLYRLLSVKLKECGLDKLFFEVEMPLIYVLNRMQRDGVKIDIEALRSLLDKVESKICLIEGKIFGMTGKKFNLNSPKQLSAVLFEELKIKPLKKTKTGYSTGEEVLSRLSHPVAKYLLEYRQLNKLKTTYINPLIEDVKKDKGLLHARFNQVLTQTGRLSSSSPNLQSIPVKGEFSRRLRKAFVPSFSGGYILAGDYSQIELRILAHLSADESLVKAFIKDLDIHSFTATLLFGVEKEKVTDFQRNLAKRVNFGIIYGMSNYGLAKELDITPEEARDFIEDYFKRYPGVKIYVDEIKQQAEKEGFVKTILGRRRKLEDIKSHNIQLREFARRQAINTPIQGSCADIIKIAMVRISNELREKKLAAKLIIQIHDELILDVPKEELDEVVSVVKKGMEGSIKLTVPIKVNIKWGRNWGEIQ